MLVMGNAAMIKFFESNKFHTDKFFFRKMGDSTRSRPPLPSPGSPVSPTSMISLQRSMTDLQNIQTQLKIAKIEAKVNAIIQDVVELHTKLRLRAANILDVLDNEDSD